MMAGYSRRRNPLFGTGYLDVHVAGGIIIGRYA